MGYRTAIARYIAKWGIAQIWAVKWGGAKRMGGRKTDQKSFWAAEPLLCRGFLYRKNRALTLEGGGKRTIRGAVQNPFLGGDPGVIREVFLPPLFCTPPWRPLTDVPV